MVCVRQMTWHFQCKPYVCRHAAWPFLCCSCLSTTLPIGHAGPVDHKMWVLLKTNKTQQQIGNLAVNSNVTVTSCVALVKSTNYSQPQFLQLRMRHMVSLGSFSAPVSMILWSSFHYCSQQLHQGRSVGPPNLLLR